MEMIPVVVDKNNIDGSYCSSADAKVFLNDEPIARTLTCKCGGGQEVHHNNMVVVMNRGNLNPSGHGINGEVPDCNGLVKTITTNKGEGQKIIVAMRGRNPEKPTDRTPGLPTVQRLEKAPEGMVNTLTTVQKDNLLLEGQKQYRIRKLTPRECWRLMGYTDEDFEKAKAAGVSNSQLYKQAGNAIVKQVLMAIFSQMICQK